MTRDLTLFHMAGRSQLADETSSEGKLIPLKQFQLSCLYFIPFCTPSLTPNNLRSNSSGEKACDLLGPNLIFLSPWKVQGVLMFSLLFSAWNNCYMGVSSQDGKVGKHYVCLLSWPLKLQLNYKKNIIENHMNSDDSLRLHSNFGTTQTSYSGFSIQVACLVSCLELS